MPNRGHRGGPRRQHRGHNTFSRPAARPSLWQKILNFFGLGSQKKADAPAARAEKKELKSARTAEKPASKAEKQERPPRPARPLALHEITTGRLYVGNLSYDVTESDLFELFSGFGKVKHTEIACHRQTQRSKGFGFVEMFSVEEARRAAEELHDKEFMGRKMLVTGAKSEAAPAANGAGAVTSAPVQEFTPSAVTAAVPAEPAPAAPALASEEPALPTAPAASPETTTSEAAA